MKILQIIPEFQAGGAELLAHNLHVQYLKRGLDSHLLSICESRRHPSTPGLASLGVTSSPYSPKALNRLRNFLRSAATLESCPTLIHTHLFPDQLYTPLATVLAGISAPLVTTIHSTDNRRRAIPLGRLLDRCVFRRYQAFACISSGVLKSFSAWLPQYRSMTRLIYNGIDLSAFTPDRKPAAGRKNLIITSVGRLVAIKNHRLVLSALKNLRDIDLQYWIVGDGPLRDELAGQVKDSRLDDRVRFFGYQEDIAPILANSDIFVLPSLYEGFGLAAVEAMAMGLPVIASNVEGIREIIGEQGCCGFLVDPTDHGQLSEFIRELSVSPELRQDMAARSLERASRYSIEKTSDDYLDLYTQVLNNN